jgi:hypothetical protein
MLVACTEQPLTELAGVRELEGHAVWHGRGADGWQVVQLHRPPVGWRVPMTGSDGLDRLLASLLAQTRPSVLAATVLDSDGAQLVGYSPRAGRWSGWLMLERMIEYIGSPHRSAQ